MATALTLNLESHSNASLDNVYTPPHLLPTEVKTHQQMDKVVKEADETSETKPTELNVQATKLPADFSLALLLIVAAHQRLSNEGKHVSKDTHMEIYKQLVSQMDKQSKLNDKRWSFYFKIGAALLTIGTSPLNLLGSKPIFDAALKPLSVVPSVAKFLAKAGPEAVSKTGVGLGSGASAFTNVFGEDFQTKEQFEIQKIDKFLQFLNRVYDEANRRGLDGKKDEEKFLDLIKQIYNQMYSSKRAVNTGQ